MIDWNNEKIQALVRNDPTIHALWQRWRATGEDVSTLAVLTLAEQSQELREKLWRIAERQGPASIVLPVSAQSERE